MVITEFGVTRRDLYNGTLSSPWSGVGPSDPTLFPESIPTEYRAEWHYDVRTSFEASGLGWTVYTYRGGFGLQNRAVFQNHAVSTGLVSNGVHTYLPKMLDALFGSSRP